MYDVARQAQAKGWQQLVILDDLSKRQINENILFYDKFRDPVPTEAESPGPEVVLVGVNVPVRRPHWGRARYAARYATTEARGIIASRLALQDAIIHLAKGYIEGLGPFAKDTPWDRHYITGLQLFDPDRPMFTSEETPLTGLSEKKSKIDEVLQPASLPAEVRDEIVHLATEVIPIKELTAAPAELSWSVDCMELCSLTRIPDDELQTFESEITTSLQQDARSCRIYNWHGQEAGTRNDFCRLRQHLIDNNPEPKPMPFLIFDPAIWKSQGRLVIEVGTYNRPLLLRKVHPVQASEIWRKSAQAVPERYNRRSYVQSDCHYPDDVPEQFIESWREHFSKLPDEEDSEILIKPDQRFHKDYVPWLSPSLDLIPPVFYLTNALTEEEDATVRRELHRDNDEGTDPGTKDFCYVPWEGKEDGTDNDIINLLHMCARFQGGRNAVHCIMCIDAKAVQNGEAIVANFHWNTYYYYVYHDEFEGMETEFDALQCERVPLSIAYAEWERVEMGRRRIRREDLSSGEFRSYDGLVIGGNTV